MDMNMKTNAVKAPEGASPRVSAKTIARVGVLAAISAILYAIPGIPVISSIYKLDFSTLPVLIGGCLMGPLSGLVILLIKDLTGLMHTSSMGVGEIADFIASGALMLVSSLIIRKDYTVKRMVLGLLAGVAAMAAVGALANLWILIPFYMNVMNFPEMAIVGMIQKVIPAVDSIGKVVAFAALPFNLIKGALLAVLTLLLLPRIKPLFT